MKRQSLSRCLSWFSILALALGAPALWQSPDADYAAQRNYIIADESRNSLGGKLEFEYGERAANDILMKVKKEEIDRGFHDASNFLLARSFLIVAEDIRRSPTFQIIRKMPKGAVLHAHDIGVISGKFVYENVTFRENLYVCRLEDGSIDFRFLRSADNDTTCTSALGWELLADLRANKTIAEDVNTMIRNALTMVVPNPAEVYPDVNAVWPIALKIFGRLTSLLNYLPVYIDYSYQILTEMREDNVIYLELRSPLSNLYDLNGNTYGPVDMARIYKATTDRFVNDHPDFIGSKMIFAPIRNVTAAQMDEYLVTAAALKKELPDTVVGMDLVGPEEGAGPLYEFADKLKAISHDIRLFLHAGETKWNGLSTDLNLIDAVLLNTTRIGHGYALLKHPRVLELVKEREIAIEVNPISNQLLTLVHDMRNHPASFLIAENYPVVISCDDPGLWGARGQSYDFYAAFVGIMSRSADIRALKQLAINSIKYSALSEVEKTRAFTIWKDKWTRFIKDLVQENGEGTTTSNLE